MSKIEIMDCTLRDGGWVNNFEFGKQDMQSILFALEDAGVHQIELGYMDYEEGSPEGRSMYSGFEAIRNNGLTDRRRDRTFRTVMIDYGRFPAEEIPLKEKSGIDGIRLAFHKYQLDDSIEYGKQILDKGYTLYIQPMMTTRYSDEELKRTVERVQRELEGLKAFYVVDSLGVLNEKEIAGRILLVDQYLDNGIRLGLHTHNNRNLSFSNAMEVCRLVPGIWGPEEKSPTEKNPTEESPAEKLQRLSPDRILNVDCTLSGFGKGAGNLVTEDFSAYLNRYYQGSYDKEALQDLAEKQISPMRRKYKWGFAPEYELTARYRTTSTYAKVFMQEYGRTLMELEVFLASIPEEKKDAFDREYTENYLRKL